MNDNPLCHVCHQQTEKWKRQEKDTICLKCQLEIHRIKARLRSTKDKRMIKVLKSRLKEFIKNNGKFNFA